MGILKYSNWILKYSKCISNLNVKHRTIKLREDNFGEENIGENIDDLGYDAFIDKT